MPKTKISEYSATANSNTDVASINIDEGCAPSGINNAIRAVMGHLKDFQQGTNGDPFNGPVNGTLGATTASTANVTTLTTSSTVTHNGGTANGVAYLNGSKVLTTGSALVFDGTNLGVGVTPSAWSSTTALQVGSVGGAISSASTQISLSYNWVATSTGNKYITNGFSSIYQQNAGAHAWYNAPSGTAGNAISFTQAMTLDASGNLLVGTTAAQLDGSSKMVVLNSSATVAEFTASSGTATQAVLRSWNTATSGDNLFQTFHTDAGATQRGSITYNRAGGLVAYNTTSDYRAKDISGYVTDSGSVIDSVPVYIGKMKDATQERPMFIAHETPAYAHVGEKDAVDADGNPVYQQMDASALIPVMWAEIQSLRKRLATAGI